MNRFLKILLLALPLTLSSLATAEPGGYLDLQTGASLTATKTGVDLVLGTTPSGKIRFMQGQTPLQTLSTSGLVAPTADGADSGSFCLSGGGACGGARGSSIYLYGNEEGGDGYLDLVSGDGKIRLSPHNDSNRWFTFDAASDTAHTLTFGDGGTTAAQTLGIYGSTSDGDDDGYICLNAGGTCSTSRGGEVVLYGADYGGAGNGGAISIQAGDGSGGYLEMRVHGDANRQLKFDAGSDTALDLQFGDGGTTDNQALHIYGSTPDNGDDSRVCVGGGGAVGTTRGAYFCADGNENGGSFIINIPDQAGASYVNRIYNSTGTWQYADMYGTTWSKRIVTTTVTPSGATTDTSNFIPAGSVVHGCTARVITAITGATTWSMGTTADTDRYGTGFAVGLNTVTTSTNWVPATAGEGVEWHTNAATAIRLTAAGSNFTGGSVRIGCMVDSMGAPSS